jgi:hypothetical protein
MRHRLNVLDQVNMRRTGFSFLGLGIVWIVWMLFVVALNLGLLAAAIYVVVWMLRHLGVL